MRKGLTNIQIMGTFTEDRKIKHPIYTKYFFYIKIKKTTIYNLPSIVKKDIKSPGLHYGWHLQTKLIFYTKNKERDHKNQYTVRKKTDY